MSPAGAGGPPPEREASVAAVSGDGVPAKEEEEEEVGMGKVDPVLISISISELSPSSSVETAVKKESNPATENATSMAFLFGVSFCMIAMVTMLSIEVHKPNPNLNPNLDDDDDAFDGRWCAMSSTNSYSSWRSP